MPRWLLWKVNKKLMNVFGFCKAVVMTPLGILQKRGNLLTTCLDFVSTELCELLKVCGFRYCEFFVFCLTHFVPKLFRLIKNNFDDPSHAECIGTCTHTMSRLMLPLLQVVVDKELVVFKIYTSKNLQALPVPKLKCTVFTNVWNFALPQRMVSLLCLIF